ncbi:MAG: proton-conducting transporter membrane subunit [bacterium]
MMSNDFYYLGLIVLFPLIGALINGLFGAKLPKSWSGFIATTAMFLAFVTSIMAVRLFNMIGEPHLTYTAYQWIHTGSLHLDLAFLLDPLSSVMILIITGVGFLIHLYSTSYMEHDPGKWRYFTYLNLFVFAMLLLVLGKNMLVTFIGWEGVGACSYLLIGFWYSDDEKAAAGQKAFIVNRVGDFAFILGILLLYTETGTFDYVEMNAMLGTAVGAAKLAPIAIPVVLLIFIGCTERARRFHSTRGFQTLWRVRPPSRRSSTPQRW